MKKDTARNILLNVAGILPLAAAALIIKTLCFNLRSVSLSTVQTLAYYSVFLCAGVCIVLHTRLWLRGSKRPSSTTFKYLSYGVWFFFACAVCSLFAMFLGKENNYVGYFFIFGTVSLVCSLSLALPEAAACARDTNKADACVFVGGISIILSLLPAVGFAAGAFGSLMSSAALNRESTKSSKLPVAGLVLSGVGMIASCAMTVVIAGKCFN